MQSLTPLESFLKHEQAHPEKTFLRQPVNGTWQVYSFKRAGDESRRIAQCLTQLNLPPSSHIAILSKNCAHWLLTDLAIMMAGHVSVPIYPTLSAQGIKHILDHSGSRVIFIGKLDHYETQRPGISEALHKITFPFYGVDEGDAWDNGLKHERMENINIPSGDALATIMYSSGTTGTPKGVMLTHGAFGFVGDRVREHLKVTATDRFFSYLPLSHIAERALMEMVALSAGSSISFAESLDLFNENLQHETPTIFGGVPRIYAKFQEGILAKMPQQKLSRLLSIPLIGTLVKKTIRKKLGLNKARIIVSGAAPIPTALLYWFKTLGIDIGEIYGMTENTAFSHANYQQIKIGTVGQPWPGAEAKISDSGEILVRSKATMIGYYKDEETTSTVLTTDGYLRTGDTGEVDKDGFLTITGRVKDQFKTDKAKFIAPAPIELQLLNNADVGQVCVVGNGIPQPIALIVPSAQGKTKSKDALCESIAATIERINPTLESYERLAKAVILKEEWTVENGLLTPSLKLKRNELEKIHLQRYPEWYKEKDVVVYE